MKLTPAQVGMTSLLGQKLRMGDLGKGSLPKRIKAGREFLMRITKQDFGYDALRWHDYLWDTNAGGYRWSRRSRSKWTRYVEAAISREDWQGAVEELLS